MNRLPPIPIPPERRWREFRFRFLPYAAFAVAVFCVVLVWRQSIGAPMAIGEVQRIESIVASPEAGSLSQLTVELFQEVNAGDPLAVVSTTSPKVLAASLAVIRADIDLLRTGMDPYLNQQRNAINFQGLRLDHMRQRVELATARMELALAEKECARYAKLYADKIVAEGELDVVNATRDTARARVEENERLVQEIGAALGDYEGLGKKPETTPPSVQAAIQVEEEKLRLTEAQMSPHTLRAPIKGLVAKIYRHPGETVAAAEPILSLSATSSEYILGYMRQPIQIEPKAGMAVRVRTQTPLRLSGMSQILRVGSQMELVSNPMRVRGLDPSQERGLPFLLSLPKDLNVHPGELVDLILLPEAQ